MFPVFNHHANQLHSMAVFYFLSISSTINPQSLTVFFDSRSRQIMFREVEIKYLTTDNL
jgi:hypothetical protein